MDRGSGNHGKNLLPPKFAIQSILSNNFCYLQRLVNLELASLHRIGKGRENRCGDVTRAEDVDPDAIRGFLEVNSIALLKSQQTFQQSFYSSVRHPVVLEKKTLLKSLFKGMLRFQQNY